MKHFRPAPTFIALAVALLAFPASLKAGSGGSIYSMLGIGDLRQTTSVRSAGMGYAGSALLSSQYLNINAPATWSRLNRTRLEAGAIYEGFSSSDGSMSRYLAQMNFFGATLGIPVSGDHGIAVAAGFVPYSNVDYDTYTHGAGTTSTDSIPFSFHHIGSGAINVGKLGASYMPVPSLSLGATFDYYFGTIDYTGTFLPKSGYTGGRLNRSTTYRGIGGTFGVLITNFGSVLEALRPLSLGLTVTSRTALSSTQQTSFGFGGDLATYFSELDTLAEQSGQVVLPLSYTVGLSYVAGERLVLAADYTTQPWRQSSVNGLTPANLGNSWRIGGGMERLPSRDRNASWAERLALRLGASYGTSYYRLNGVAIDEWVVTGGLTLPVSQDSRLHLAAEYGVRGKMETGLVRDRIFRFSASFSIGELWFQRMDEE